MKKLAAGFMIFACVFAQKPREDGCPGKKAVLGNTCVRECPDGFITTYSKGYPECS